MMSLRSGSTRYDVVVIGAGPNGLSAAIALARAGLSVLVVEAHAEPGGGTRSHELTLPGFMHDICSSVHPLGVASPFFKTLGLERHGLQWVKSPSELAHVLDDGSALTLERSIAATAEQFARDDARAYRRLFEPLTAQFDRLLEMILRPLRFPASPLTMARFGLHALRSMRGLAHLFRDPAPKALLAGMAAHAMVPLDWAGSASFALVLGMAGHAVGWPVARGGSRSIAGALVASLRESGGEVQLNRSVHTLGDLPSARAYLFDVTPRQLLAITGDRFPSRYRRRLARFRYGPGVFKMDWALDGPIPWKDARCARASTVHLAGTLEEVSAAEAAVEQGKHPEHPFVLLVQPTLFDAARAPPGKHTAWAYCHVPHGSTIDASQAIESRVEQFAPGFRQRVLARSARNPIQMEAYNPNYVGGDINGGAADLRQLFFRPVPRIDPYATPDPRIFICSSSTPPGGGVHGMCGYWGARSVLARAFHKSSEVDDGA